MASAPGSTRRVQVFQAAPVRQRGRQMARHTQILQTNACLCYITGLCQLCPVGAQVGAAGRRRVARKGLRGLFRAFLSFSVVRFLRRRGRCLRGWTLRPWVSANLRAHGARRSAGAQSVALTVSAEVRELKVSRSRSPQKCGSSKRRAHAAVGPVRARRDKVAPARDGVRAGGGSVPAHASASLAGRRRVGLT